MTLNKGNHIARLNNLVRWCNLMAIYKKHFAAILLFIAGVYLILPSIVLAAPAPENPDEPIAAGNGLSWGVTNGTILDYILTAEITIPNVTYYVNKPIFMTLNYLGPIPDSFFYIPSPSFDTYWAENGSALYLGDFFVVGTTVHSVYNPAIPIGNWTLLTVYTQSSMIEGVYENVTLDFIDNSLEWGYRYSYYYFGYFIESETIWFKSDGSLESVHLEVSLNEQLIYTVTLARVTGIDPIILISIAGVSIFGIATVVLAYQYIRDRKESTTSATL